MINFLDAASGNLHGVRHYLREFSKLGHNLRYAYYNFQDDEGETALIKGIFSFS